MKGSIIAKVVILFVFVWCAIMGTYLNINPNDTSMVWGGTLISFCVITIIMMIVPVIYRIFRGQSVSYQKGKNICKWNSIVVLFILMIIDIIIMGGIYDEVFQNLGTNIVYAVIYYYINSRLLFSTNNENMEETARICDKEENKTFDNPNAYGYGMDFIPTEQFFKDIPLQEPYVENIQKEEKTYKNNYLLFIVIVVAVISIVGNVIQYFNSNMLRTENKEYERLIDEGFDAGVISILNNETGKHYIFNGGNYQEYFEFWRQNHDKVDYMDENIVFVLEGYGDYYYTYDQVQEVTQGREYQYWVYHRENAIKAGYTAWQ